jgi:hypothetical protein
MATEAAHRLSLSVQAVAYRPERIWSLAGATLLPATPYQTVVFAARLLDRPADNA